MVALSALFALLVGSALARDGGSSSAPRRFRVRFETTAGAFEVDVHRRWAPHGADRLLGLVRSGAFVGDRFYRVEPGELVEWGLSDVPARTAEWSRRRHEPDPGTRARRRSVAWVIDEAAPVRLVASFGRGEEQAPLGRVPAEYLPTLRALRPPGEAPQLDRIRQEGAAWLDQEPELDRIEAVRIRSAVRHELFFRVGGALHTGPRQSAGGLGFGLGYRLRPTSLWSLHASVSPLVLLGPAAEVVAGTAVHLPVLRTWQPGIGIEVADVVGSRLRFVSSAAPQPVTLPPAAARVLVQPASFRHGDWSASVLAPSVGVGLDGGTAVGVEVLSIGRTL